ncbi:MAG TPA: DUF2970 domain-containing protein [Burkholderiaceae bacterium]|nr:DUF2970 domain-containing protein [Burkholderiaceae bacterium]
MNEASPPSAGLSQAVRRKASWGQTARAVLWSFFGVRKRRDHAQDVAQLNPVHVIVMGVIAAALFVALLITVVYLVVPG